MFNKFKLILPEIMEERTNFMNNWLNKYNEVIEEEVKNIDNNSSQWLGLFEEGNKLITEIRMVADMK